MRKRVARLVMIAGLLAMINGGIMGKMTEPIVASSEADNTDVKCLTPFQQTVENVKAFLFATNNHAFTMEEIIAGIEHHYTTDDRAQNSLRVWIDAGLVQGIVSIVGKSDPTRYYLDWAKRSANLPGARNRR